MLIAPPEPFPHFGFEQNVITHPSQLSQLERRNMLTDCNSWLALDTWKLDRPSNASAAICFHGKYDLTSWDADHYKPRVKTACTVRNWLKFSGWDKKQ